MIWAKSFLSLLFLAFALGIPSLAHGGEILLGDGSFTSHVKSVKELRDSRIVRQNYDFSCGSAAVATLLTYGYDTPTTEDQAFKAMYAVGNQDHIRKVGFSLLDMQKYLASLGLHADGYAIPLERLQKLRVPAIVLISPGGYNHFVVLRGWDARSVIVADPNRGLRRLMIEDFKEMWNGIVLVLHDKGALAHTHYNDPEDLKIVPHMSGDAGLGFERDSMTGFFLHLPSLNEF